MEQPSMWAVDRFGPVLAPELRRRVPHALACAVNRAVDAHEASQMTTNHAFGSARWPIQYEELVKHLHDLNGASTIRPWGAFYQLVIVGNHLLLPWCFAQTPNTRMRDIRPGRSFGRLAREILGQFGPPPHWSQPALPWPADDDEDEQQVHEVSSLLRTIQPPPRVLIVGYACSPQLGLLSVEWGEAALGDGDHLHWYHDEQLPVPTDAASGRS